MVVRVFSWALMELVHSGAAVPGVISPDLTPLVDVRPQR